MPSAAASTPWRRRERRARLLRPPVPIDPAARDAAIFYFDTEADPIGSLIAIHSAARSLVHVLRRQRRPEALLASDPLPSPAAGRICAARPPRRTGAGFAVYLRGAPSLVRASMRRWSRVAPRTAIRAGAASGEALRTFAPLAVVREGCCYVERRCHASLVASLRGAGLPLGELDAAQLRALAASTDARD